MWVPKLLLPPLKTRIFGPKKAKFGPKYAFFGTYETVADVPENSVWSRADFQSGSKVLKGVLNHSLSMAYNVIS